MILDQGDTILYAVYAGGAVVATWIIGQLRVWRAKQDREVIEAKAFAEGEN